LLHHFTAKEFVMIGLDPLEYCYSVHLVKIYKLVFERFIYASMFYFFAQQYATSHKKCTSLFHVNKITKDCIAILNNKNIKKKLKEIKYLI
jgi:hypothetical protein